MNRLQCKIIEGKVYIASFPEEYIKTEKENRTGPRCCENCAYYGCIEEVFIGYCLNCASYIYNYERGPGLDTVNNIYELKNMKTNRLPIDEIVYLQKEKQIIENIITKLNEYDY